MIESKHSKTLKIKKLMDALAYLWSQVILWILYFQLVLTALNLQSENKFSLKKPNYQMERFITKGSVHLRDALIPVITLNYGVKNKNSEVDRSVKMNHFDIQ